jgi:hypothetical protein
MTPSRPGPRSGPAVGIRSQDVVSRLRRHDERRCGGGRAETRVRAVDPRNEVGHRGVVDRAGRRRPGLGGVVRRRGDRQDLADRLDPERTPVLVDEGTHFGSRGWATASTTPSPRRSTGCARPSSSGRRGPGGRQTRSSSRPRPGSPDGTTSVFTRPAATSHRPSSRPPTITGYRRPRLPETQSRGGTASAHSRMRTGLNLGS